MRLSRRALVAVTGSVLCLCMMAVPAVAGGNWIETRNRYNVVGDTAVAHATFYAKNHARVRAGGPYFAYLAPETPGWTLPDPRERHTIRLGRVRIVSPGSARIRFSVPELSSGSYLIAFCNRPCTRRLGDVDPTGWFWIVQNEREARLRQRLLEVRTEFEIYRYEARRRMTPVIRSLKKDLTDEQVRADALRLRTDLLAERLATLRREGGADGRRAWVLLVVGMIAAGALGFGAGHARRRQAHRRLLDAEIERLITHDRGAPEPRETVGANAPD